MTGSALPGPLAEVQADFLALEESDRLQLLSEYSDDLPAASGGEGYERVTECQSPVFILLEVEDGRVRMSATAPAEAPTTRGFASLLVHALAGLTPDEVLAIPEDFPQTLGLARVVSPLRIAGMAGMLGRAKRQVRVLQSGDGA